MNLVLKELIQEVPIIGELLFNAFYKSNIESEEIDPNYAFLCFLENLGYFLDFNNYRISDINQSTIPFSLYTLGFLQSGNRKDNSFKLNRDIFFPDLIEKRKIELKNKYEEYLTSARNKIEGDYSKLEYSNTASTYSKKQELLEKEFRKFRNPEASFLGADDTLEGVISERLWYQTIGFGSAFFKLSEGVSFFKNINNEKEPLLRHLIEAYENGDGQAKTIKAENVSREIKNVPVTVHIHTSITEELPSKLINFLEIGGMRRFLVYYQNNKEINQKPKGTTIDEIFEENLDDISLIDYSKLTKIKEQIDLIFSKPNKVIYLNERIKKIALQVQKFYRSRQIDNLAIKNYHDIPYRALRIASILQVLSGCTEKDLREDFYKVAIKITQFYAETAILFFDKQENENLFDKVLNHIKESEDLKISFSDLSRKLKIKSGDNVEKIFANFFSYIEKNGYKVEEYKSGRGSGYTLIKIEEAKNIKIKISQAVDNSDKNTIFKPAEVDWNDFEKITSANKSWSASTFKDNKRKDSNSLGNIQVIGLDIDNGMSLEDAKEFFEKTGYEVLISTTRNHRKEKEGLIADRFRIVIPLLKPFTGTPEEYKNRMNLIYDFFGLPFDKSTQNISRLWFGNPEAEHVRIKGVPLDFDSFQKKIEPKKTFFKTYEKSSDDKKLIEYWSSNGVVGSRYLMLYKAFHFYKDKGLNGAQIHAKIHEINDKFPIPHEYSKIEYDLNRWFKEFG